MRAGPAIVVCLAVLPIRGIATQQFSQTAAVANVQVTETRTVWDGVYSTLQSERGRRLYAVRCASCHGDDLLAQGPDQIARDDVRIAGGAPQRTPALRGAAFISNWNGLAVDDLFERTRISMPQEAPGSLSGQQVADVVAYLLQENGCSSGDSELPKDREFLKQIKIVSAW